MMSRQFVQVLYAVLLAAIGGFLPSYAQPLDDHDTTSAALETFKPIAIAPDSPEVDAAVETLRINHPRLSAAKARQAVETASKAYNQALNNLDPDVVATFQKAARAYAESKDREAALRHQAAQFEQQAHLLFEQGGLRQQDAIEEARARLAEVKARLAQGESLAAIGGVDAETFARTLATHHVSNNIVFPVENEGSDPGHWFCSALYVLLQNERAECEARVESGHQTCLQGAMRRCGSSAMVQCPPLFEECEERRKEGMAHCWAVMIAVYIGSGCMPTPEIPSPLP